MNFWMKLINSGHSQRTRDWLYIEIATRVLCVVLHEKRSHFSKKELKKNILTRFKRVRILHLYFTQDRRNVWGRRNWSTPISVRYFKSTPSWKGEVGEADYALDIPFNLSASSFKKQNIVSFNLEQVMVQKRISHFKIILRKIQRKFDKRLLLCCKEGSMKF